MSVPGQKNANVGGRLAANFRAGTIAEVFAANLMQTFAAIAPIPRHEDYGLDLVGILLKRMGKVYLAENSFVAQVKIRTAANFAYNPRSRGSTRKGLPAFGFRRSLSARFAAGRARVAHFKRRFQAGNG